MTPTALRDELKGKLGPTVARLNQFLEGKKLGQAEASLQRLGRGGKLPHWYAELKNTQSLPQNLDGKTIGSVIEMLFVAALETFTFAEKRLRLKINPAKGTDLPDLDLGVKSPSKNFCTSEPFFSAYERLIGSKHDALVLLTNFQEIKKARNKAEGGEIVPFKLQITQHRYLEKSEIADFGLCKLALKNRAFLLEEDETWAKKFFRFLAYVNKADWRAKQLLKFADAFTNPGKVPSLIASARKDFEKTNKDLVKKEGLPLPESELASIERIQTIQPAAAGIIDALDKWVWETFKEAARSPSDTEWDALLASPLNGKIGISLALQWRYNFRKIFNGNDNDKECEPDICDELSSEDEKE